MFRKLLFLLLLAGFAFSQVTIGTCTNISNPGSYVLNANLVGNNTYAGVQACIYVNSSHVSLDCNNYDITGNVAGASTRGIYITGVDNVSIKNCRDISRYNQGIRAVSSTNISVNNSILHDMESDCIYFDTIAIANETFNTASNCSDGFHIYNSAGIYLAENTAYGNSVNGFYMTVGTIAIANWFHNNTAHSNQGYGIFLQETEGTHYLNVVSNNTVYNNSLSGIGNYGGLLNVFWNNTVYNNSEYGLEIDHTNLIAIWNNTARDNGWSGIALLGSENCSSVRNTIYDNTQHGFYVSYSNWSNYTDNVAYHNQKSGFYLSNSHFNILTTNNASDNNNSGIGLSFADTNLVWFNNVSNNNLSGVALVWSDSNQIRRNIATDNIISGFDLGASRYNYLYRNNATGNGIGFNLEQGGSDNNVTNNTADDNGFGFIFQNGALRNNVDNNTASLNWFAVFIFDAVTFDNNFTNNFFYDNTNSGVYLITTKRNNFFNNHIYDNGGEGFAINATNDSIFQGNEVYGNTQNGFYVVDASGNNFTDTVAYNNSGYGIHVQYISVPTASTFTNTLIYNQSNYLRVTTPSYQNNFTNITLGYNASIGLVNYPFLGLTGVNLYTDESDLPSSTIILREYWVSLSDVLADEANKTANITIYTDDCLYSVRKKSGFPISWADIIVNGTVYPTTKTCVGASAPYTATFNVSGFSGYALGQQQTYLNLTFLPSDNVTYKTETNVSCNSSNSEVLISLYNNATGSMVLVAGPSANYVQYLANHSAGLYNYTCNTSGNANYTAANLSGLLTVNKNTTICSLDISPPSGGTYPTAVTATCSCTNADVPATLWRNGTDVTATENGTARVIPGGTWNYTCNVTETENYTSASNSSIYIINPATTTLDFQAMPPSPVTLGNITNISCNASNDQVIVEIFVNGSSQGSGPGYFDHAEAFPVGTYEFICNTTGNENYTAANETISPYQVNKITTVLDLVINTSSWTVRPNTPTNVSCSANSPLITIELWRAGVLVDSGPGYAEDLDTLAIGSYPYVCNATATENYTAATVTNTLAVRKPSEGGEGRECYLTLLYSEDVPVGVPMQIGVQRDEEVMLYNAEVVVIRYSDGDTTTLRTNVAGYATFTPEEAGLYTVAAEFRDCDPTDGTFTAYLVQELIVDYEQSCEGGIVTVRTEVCEGLEPPEEGAGAMGCREMPVPGVEVEAYFCPIGAETDCPELIGTYTTDAAGQVVINAFDGNVRIYIPATDEYGEFEDYYQLPASSICIECETSEDCEPGYMCVEGFCVPIEEVQVGFEPGCEGSTATVTGTVCSTMVLVADIYPYELYVTGVCSEVPLPGMRVSVYCCPEGIMMMDVDTMSMCTELASGTTDASGEFRTSARDCGGEAFIFVPRILDTRMVDTWEPVSLPTTEECAECLSDSDCPEGYVCRDYMCVPEEERRCTSDEHCTSGHRCSEGFCTEITRCAADADCPTGFGCLEGICYTEEEIEQIREGEEGVEGEKPPSILDSIFGLIITSSWLIILLLALLLLWFFFFAKRRKKKKPLTEEELIAREEELGEEPRPPRPPRRK